MQRDDATSNKKRMNNKTTLEERYKPYHWLRCRFFETTNNLPLTGHFLQQPHAMRITHSKVIILYKCDVADNMGKLTYV